MMCKCFSLIEFEEMKIIHFILFIEVVDVSKKLAMSVSKVKELNVQERIDTQIHQCEANILF